MYFPHSRPSVDAVVSDQDNLAITSAMPWKICVIAHVRMETTATSLGYNARTVITPPRYQTTPLILFRSDSRMRKPR